MQQTSCVLLALTPLLAAWVALFVRAVYRDRLIRLASPLMEQGEQKTEWTRSSPGLHWLLQPVRRIRLLKSAALPAELQHLRQRFTAMTYIAAALVALVIVVAMTAHLVC